MTSTPKHKKTARKSTGFRRTTTRKAKIVGGEVGTVQYSDGTYHGNVEVRGKKRMRHGIGEMRYKNGDVYTGDWVNGKRKGNGKMTYAMPEDPDDPEKHRLYYVGRWDKNIRNGQGTMRYVENGDQYAEYTGDWVDGERHGKGAMKLGMIFDEEDEEGIMQTDEQDMYATYEGNWVHGRMKGKGVMTYVNDDVYVGDFDIFHGFDPNVDDDNADLEEGFHGYGVMTYGPENYDDYVKYEGEWRNRVKHGQGTMEYEDGRVWTGMWNKDERVLAEGEEEEEDEEEEDEEEEDD